MHPDLVVGSLHASSYFTMMAVGFAVALGVGLWLGPRVGLRRRDAFECWVTTVVWGTLGGKLGHLVLESRGHALPDGRVASGVGDVLRADPWHWARLLDGGYVWYGGVLLAVAVLYLRTRRLQVDRGALADAAAPGYALGVTLGRLGCFLGGCCYGVPSTLPWAVTFPAGVTPAPGPVHPVQLYDAVFGLLWLAVLGWRLPRRRFAGELFALTMVTYALWRFALEGLRGDAERGLYLDGALSTSQLISLAVLPAAGFYLWRGYLGALGPRPVLDAALQRQAVTAAGVAP